MMRKSLVVAWGSCLFAQQWVTVDRPVLGPWNGAFDDRRQRLVVYDQVGETWEHGTGAWLHRAPLGAPPPPRILAAMAYDSARGHVLLFGGRTGNVNYFGDTWVYDGARWRQLTAAGPSPRFRAVATFDPVRARVVLFGGQTPTSAPPETWEHDGAQWTQRPTAAAPPGGEGLAYDQARGVTVLVGGSNPMQTWTWNGTAWTQRATTAVIAQRTNLGLVYDPLRQRTVLYGGYIYSNTTGNEIWEWDGTTWTVRASTLPTAPDLMVGWFDAASNRATFAGGQDSTRGGYQNDAWAWDGTALQQAWPADGPGGRFDPLFVADPVRGELVLFSGTAANSGLPLAADMWAWNGQTWAPRTPLHLPSPRAGAAGAFELLTGHALMFGGSAAGVNSNELWSWDGADWTLLASGVGGPLGRSFAGMSYDLSRLVTVMFGGLGDGGTLGGDTWEWNGTAWSQHPGPVHPSPRYSPAMTYDLHLGATVLFGGQIGPTALDQRTDTWTWNGGSWHPVLTSTPAPVQLSPSLVFDFAANRTRLSGSVSVGTFPNASWLFQVWEFDGANWTQISSAASVGFQQGYLQSVYDLTRGAIVAYDSTSLRDLAAVPAEVTGYGAGCGSPPPQLMPRARPRVGAATAGLEFAVAPGQAVLFGLSFAQANTPLGGGCTLLLGAGSVALFGVADARGNAALAIPIANDSRLIGQTLLAQGAVLSPSSPLGFDVTSGLRLRVGD
jgi:hypothetical protein